MKFYYTSYFFIVTVTALPILTSWRPAKSIYVVQTLVESPYGNLILSPAYSKSIDICGATFENKDNGALFQDIRRLKLNCDSTFTWKHISCIQRDTSFGRWSVKNNTIYLTSSKKIKQKVVKQKFGNLFGEYIDLSNTTLIARESFIVWQRTKTWVDTLYRH